MGRDVPDTAIDPERRVFFQRALSSSAAAGALLAGSAALHSATRDPKVQRVEVTLDRLPKELDGFKIVQISDLHVSATIKRPYVERVVAMANELAPDLVALTGDLMDGSVPLLRDDMAPIGDLKSTHGSYFCTGNHEYYSGVEPWLVELRRLGVRVLRNERVGVVGLDVAGIDDAQAARFGGDHGPDLKKALAGRNPERPVVLLAHQPKAIDEATEMGVDLVLSGHTHGGQIWPFGFLVRLAQPYVAGLHTHRLGGRATQIYVSRGTGYWGPPMRLGAPHELTLITLRSAEDARD
ncbi:MAG: metallophosphoesterase [Myxococcales bacterium]|nr:metallophosphoesterase [Myxococcales bacterium]